MSEKLTFGEKLEDWYQVHKREVIAGVGSSALVAAGSAAPLNGTIGPIINEVALLFEPIMNLVIATVPPIIVLAVVGFLLGMFDGILARIRIG